MLASGIRRERAIRTWLGMRDFLRELSRGRDGCRVLLISHSANRRALDHLLNGAPLEELANAPFDWQPGWKYTLPDVWTGD